MNIPTLDSLVYWVALHSVPGLGPVTYRKLLQWGGDPKSILFASKRDLNSLPWLKEGLIKAILKARVELEEKTRLLDRLYRQGVRVVTLQDEDYPQKLKEIKSSPVVIYIKGKYLKRDDKAVAIVGSTRPSEKGYRIAQESARRLALKGYTIVSGYARGIDTAAHIGALETGGRTIMAIPMGIEAFSWRREFSPYVSKEEGYLILSESLPSLGWQTGAALSRNKLIASLSSAVFVVETDVRGGALHTFSFAQRNGRKTFVLRYKKPPTTARGNEFLLRRGGTPISNFKEVEEIMV